MHSLRILTFLTFLVGASCGGPQIPNLDSPGRSIVCFGDSITAGVGAGSEPTYPELLADRLGVEVVNAGVPGDTAEEGLARIDQVLAHDPWLVIVELGGNDILGRIPAHRTQAALQEIVEQLLENRIAVVLVAVSAPTASDLEDVFDQLGKKYQVPVLDRTLRKILTRPSLKSDLIHPNAAGYRQLAHEVAEEIGPILEARRSLGRS